MTESEQERLDALNLLQLQENGFTDWCVKRNFISHDALEMMSMKLYSAALKFPGEL